ncbi:MAG: prolipoprotein diacylglyceryl transferase [Candidatus Azobacteroides pseudotrichonymphae]|jgi:prolipoprotein diacylglyceryl transferase|uniref:Phosphatidylglycerol--prolipoprotein diacylglyceryl transferase n=1 Tax=Azobacteroides pseudotrichonymphae genomovar. CFP2 TaxID=511995 RepID=B6YR87_AZOPC|nr:prolipoprotein diacylglyceryl transferase [Candidatus Azobacteroides pseudotrichonymphae]MDR0530090.1 prolipoprotein diacylglyceryl transferase [Bacteroidales bacterium OttesenSCG-928-I14]BAG83709.1 prolipoprotein diacylglyceryl transferase [Candidatus Azobacteroides pseudotrichonymphae genomovar. CFP2]GMO34756.1 MAG: prolipoprotein diacylglyceryl transferase [Candidatus Azobacteroides pseudotrichonymphae]
MLSFITWKVNPIAFTIPLVDKEVRWYGIAFAVGFTIGRWIVQKIWKQEKLDEAWLDKLSLYVVISTIIGARLGHCLFYSPNYYLSHPFEIIKVWEGGVASHGGTIGIIIAVWIYSKKITHKSMLWTFDRLVVPVGFVAALIRLGNLMNHEIYGHPTNVPWAFRFIKNVQQGGANLIFTPPSHPTQLYEAFFYMLTACVCLWMYWEKEDYRYHGLIFGVFLTGIFVPRFFIEFCKNTQESFEENMLLNMGQLLSVPFIIAGIWFIYKGSKLKKQNHKK